MVYIAKSDKPKEDSMNAKPEAEIIENAKDYHQPADLPEHEEGLSEGSLSVINAAEISQQIATAHRFPRSVTQFRRRTYELVTIDTDVAASCIYALTRDRKIISGPSVRFAELLLVGWGNYRCATEVTDISEGFITAEGVFFDLETNGAVKAKIMRRITNREGKRYSADMIATTGNAAASIALRNAVLRGIPKAIWKDLFDEATKVAAGTAQTFTARRDKTMKELAIQGATPAMIFGLLGVAGIEDVSTEHVLHLRGLQNAIKDGETTLEEAFPAGAAPGVATPPRPRQSEFEREKPKGENGTTAPASSQPAETKVQSGTSGPSASTGAPEPSEGQGGASDAIADLLHEAVEDLGNVTKIRDIGPLRDAIAAQLEGEQLKNWNEACDARGKELIAETRKASKAGR